jgi:hypothetical protein
MFDDLFKKPTLRMNTIPRASNELHPLGASRSRPATSFFASLPEGWQQQVMTRPLRALNARARGAQTEALLSVIRALDDSATVLERMGATLLLCSMVEGRVRALYRQRHALQHGLPAPSIETEEHEYLAAQSNGRTLSNGRHETYDLAKVITILEGYGDIGTLTAQELQEFTKYRNPLVHDAIYRVDQFKLPFIHALLLLYADLTLVRQRLTTRLKNERAVFHEEESVTAAMTKRMAQIPIHTFVPADVFCAYTGATGALKAPISNNVPRLFVVTVSAGIAKARISETESGYHDLWRKPNTLVGQEFFVFSHRNAQGRVGYRHLGPRVLTQVQVTERREVVVAFAQ